MVTPGYFDMRPFVGHFRFPTSMAGLSVVDVGTSNGQFAFHFERLGADRVIAVDLAHVLDHDFPDWYRRELQQRYSAAELARIDEEELEAGFSLAHEVFASKVEKRRCTVYELGDLMQGQFDVAYCSNLVQHLRDPVRALESIRRSLKPSGQFVFGCSCELSVENVSYAIFEGRIDPHITYWVPSREAAQRLCQMAGFVDVQWVGAFRFAPVPHPERVGTLAVLHARNRP
ncbi:MAG: methyltransferase domain-containing protein [Planctomycetes bacterium]|nr:methyltransferase domain-containing protein [Planctomycetota bacterium]